tara:strand:+ start:3161 stop:3397 length:237 start_codon:yes stop_codon:yes gene_type:complete
MKRLAVVVLGLLASCASPSESFVASERLYHDVIAPEYLEYVKADPTLDQAAKDRRGRTVATWGDSIKAHEALVNGGTK